MTSATVVETWMPVLGYEKLYQVSDHGRVKSMVRQGATTKILKPGENPKGYLRVGLHDGRRRSFYVHRLVYMAFVDPNLVRDIDHIDGDPGNNRLSNLRVSSPAENSQAYRKIKGVSKYRGVCLSEGGPKWRCAIKKNGFRFWLGLHENEEDAADAYNEAAIKLGFSKEALNVLPEGYKNKKEREGVEA